jgi:hypothetical protein
MLLTRIYGILYLLYAILEVAASKSNPNTVLLGRFGVSAGSKLIRTAPIIVRAYIYNI